MELLTSHYIVFISLADIAAGRTALSFVKTKCDPRNSGPLIIVKCSLISEKMKLFLLLFP